MRNVTVKGSSDSITIQQIEKLRLDSAIAADWDTVDLCEKALSGDDEAKRRLEVRWTALAATGAS